MSKLSKINENKSENDYDSFSDSGGQSQGPDLKAAMSLYLFIFILLLLIGSVVQTLHFEIGMMVTQVVLILLPALWFWRRHRVDKVKFARLHPLQVKFVPAIIILAVSMWVLNMIIASGMVTALMEFGYEPIVVIEPPQTIQQYLMLVLVLSVFAGICEEVLFRGAIMPSMESHGLVPAIVFSSILFALFHVSFLSLISTFVLGMVMAVVVIKTGSLWAGILYHMLNNFIAATYLYIAGRYETASEIDPQTYWVALPLLLLALAGSYFGFRLLQKQSKVEPLLRNRKAWLPRGWFSLLFVLAVSLFLLMAFLEMAIGFNWFNLNGL